VATPMLLCPQPISVFASRVVDVAEGLIGRDRQIALLRESLTNVAAGTGAAILVEGEQGIGKTEVLRAGLAEAADLGCRVLWGAADELGQQFPLALMAECLGVTAWSSEMSQESPAAGGSLMPAGDPVLAATERILTLVDQWCADSPVVLVTEDLHWADEASVLGWHRLSQAARQVPLLIVGSMRPAPGRDDLATLRHGVAASGGNLVTLGPLSAPEVAELVGRVIQGRPGRRLAALAAQAGGNPLYARELADALIRDGRVRVTAGVAELVGEVPAPDGTAGIAVPTSLAKVMEARLGSLSEAATNMLRWAAVLGQEFSVTDLETVTQRQDGHLAGVITEAVTAGVLADSGPRLAFRHGLIRQTVYEGMPRALRAALHLQAARMLAAAGAGPGKVAAHLVAVPGAAEGWVREWLVRAAPALIYQAPSVAAELLRAALADLADHSPERELLEAGLVRVAFMQWQHEEVVRIGNRLLAVNLDANRRAEIAWFVAYALLRQGDAVEAVTLVEHELARSSLDAAHWARLRALQAMTLTQLDRQDEMPGLATEALARAEAVGDRLGAGYALHVMFTVSAFSRDWTKGLSYVDRALAVIGDDPQAVDLRLILLSNRASLLSHLARAEEAITTSEQALAIAEQAGAYRLGFMRTQLAAAYYTAGRWDDALAELETAIATPGPGGDRVPTHGLAALIAAHRGDWSAADEHLAVVADIPIREVVWPHNSYDLLLARAMAAERSDGAAQGLAVLAPCLDPSVAGLMPDWYVVLPALARAAVMAGDTMVADTAAALAAAEPDGEGPTEITRSAVANHCQGLAAADPAALLTAAGFYRSAGQPFECAQALEDAAVLLAARGDIEAARDAFTEAAGRYQAMGARWDIDRANARLRPYGLRHREAGRRGRPVTGWDALTPTETKIARLISEGQSNSDVAARLFLSRTTVHTHVSHILAKLEARSRAEIVREALSQQTAPEHATA
jgi:DNA-binding CsgD family transcriptional regulator/tetratricopeptide (TPR) repeat protein